MDKLEEVEIRSEEVQEILTKTPNWMLHWGNLLFLVLIFLILSLAWAVKYPDVIVADAVLTTTIPPQKEYSRTTGKFDSIYVKDREEVKHNSVLAVLENSANTNDVYYLKSIIDTLKVTRGKISFPFIEVPVLLLGDIEKTYADFEDNYTEYELNKLLLPFKNESIANITSLNQERISLENLKSQYELNNSELLIKKNNLKRSKSLLEKGVISQFDYENNKIEFINTEKELKKLSIAISQTRSKIASSSQVLKGTKINTIREEAKLLRNTLQNYNQLKKAIKDWERLYVLKSEVEGRVSFHKFRNINQNVKQGDLVFTVIPTSNINYVVKLKATARNSGKIKVGLDVNIGLQNYPETEFGILKGKISSISLAPDEDGSLFIDVTIPQNLITTYNKKIEFRQEMIGNADIITEDLRLLERLFYQFRKLLNK